MGKWARKTKSGNAQWKRSNARLPSSSDRLVVIGVCRTMLRDGNRTGGILNTNKFNRVRNLAIAMIGGLALTLSAQGASFDCAMAGTKVEHLICGNPDISKLDDELAASYKAALQDKAHAEEIMQTQRQWLRKRNGCADVSCVNAIYEKRIAQLKNSNDANTQNTSVANTPQRNSAESRLSAGWDYKQEGGGMGTEPYGIGEDDEMCQQVKAYMNREAPNWVPYDAKTWGGMQNFCTTTVRFFPGFTEPPWTELDPRKYEALIAKLLQYREQGARAYFGYAKVRIQRRKGYFEDEARHFIDSGGRLQFWKVRLLDYSDDPKDLVSKQLPLGEQYVVQLRFAIDLSIDTRFKDLPCNLPDWKGAVFLVTPDLSGPDPHVFDGGASGLSSESLFIYDGKPILLNDGGFEIGLKRIKGGSLSYACELTYPYYKFN